MGEGDLSDANGLLNMATFLAILLGTITGSFLSNHLPIACAILVLASGLGLAASFGIQALPAAKPREALLWNPFRDLVANWVLIRQDRALRLGTVAVNYFWLMGAILQLNIFLYAKEMMNATPQISGFLLVAVALGIGIGSVLAGKLSRGHVEVGLVPLGGLGMGLFAIDLLFAYHSLWRVLIDFFMMGFSGGFYDIPLAALIQWRSPAGERGRVLATVNFFSFMAILAGSIVLWVLGSMLHLNPAQIFFTLGLLSVIGLSVACFCLPETFEHIGRYFRSQRPV